MDDDGQSVASVASYSLVGCEDGCVKTIYKKICHDGLLAAKDHIEAVDALCKLHAALQNAGVASRQAQIRLICTSSSLVRRLTRLDAELARLLYYSNDVAPLAQIQQIRSDAADVKRTLTLVFVTIVTMDVVALGGQPADADAAFKILEESLGRSLWAELSKRSKRRLELPDDLQYNERQRLLLEEAADRPYVLAESSSSWSISLAEPGILANAAVRAAGALLHSHEADAVDELEELGQVFSRSTNAQMSVQMLKSDRDFTTLAVQRILQLSTEDREQALEIVVSAAESEAGQAVLRDLVISFLAPKKLVGTRRTLLLSRETSAKVSKEYPWVASFAHEAAMEGAEHIYTKSKSELKRTCALLAGLAILTTRGTDDTVRKATAFGGLVQLPFIDTVAPSPSTPRLALVPTTRSWAIFTVKKGKPVVEVSKRGLEGLVLCLLVFKQNL